jgi:O-antigen/teichoic acid export membrane protein
MSTPSLPFQLPGVDSWTDLLRPAGWTFGIQVAGAGLGYGVHILIGRWLGADVYGTYLLAMGWAVLLSRFAGLGLPTAVLRLVPEYDTNSEYGLLRGLLRGSRAMVFGAGVIASLGVTGVLVATPLFSDAPHTALLIGIWLTPLLALVGLETEILRAQRRVVWAYAPPRILRPLLLIAGMGALLTTPLPNTSVLLLGLMGALLGTILVLQYVGSRRTLPPTVHTAAPAYAPKAWVQLAGPLFFTKGFLVLIGKTDIFVIGALLNTEQVGLYGAALRTAHVITFAGMALDSIASSAVSRLHTQNDWAGLQALTARLAQFYFWPTLLLAGGMAVASPAILHLFGPGFVESRPELLILMGGLLIHASTGCQEYLLTLTGHERACAWIYGVAMVLNLGLNLLGVLTMGTVGAALATAGSMVFWNGCMYVLVRRQFGIDPTIFAPLRSPHSA